MILDLSISLNIKLIEISNYFVIHFHPEVTNLAKSAEKRSEKAAFAGKTKYL